MVRNIRARYDGKVLIPEEPLDVPVGQSFDVRLILPDSTTPADSFEERRGALQTLLMNPIRGLHLPDSALSREQIYGDD